MPTDEMFRKRVVYTVPGMDAVEIRRGLVYGRAEDGDLTMDVYVPPGLGADEWRPGVVLVHGGPVPAALWPRVTSLGVFLSYGELLAASGLVAVTFNHRFVDLSEIAASQANIVNAVAFLRDHAPDHHLDPDRLAVWCFSGGGLFLAPLLREPPPSVRALLAFYAFLDLASVAGRAPIPIPDDAARDFSPAGCFPPDGPYAGPPLFIARAGQDQPWLNQTIDLFVERALAANAMLDVMTHPTGQHGFDALDDDDRSREIIARAIAFLKSHL